MIFGFRVILPLQPEHCWRFRRQIITTAAPWREPPSDPRSAHRQRPGISVVGLLAQRALEAMNSISYGIHRIYNGVNTRQYNHDNHSPFLTITYRSIAKCTSLSSCFFSEKNGCSWDPKRPELFNIRDGRCAQDPPSNHNCFPKKQNNKQRRMSIWGFP